MTQLWQFVFILAIHWVGDFMLQTRWQAVNKSKRLDALAKHVLSYTGYLALGVVYLFGLNKETFFFIMTNGVLHFITDFWTSRWTTALYAKQQWHAFFVVIGLDQLIHQVTLAGTLWWFL